MKSNDIERQDGKHASRAMNRRNFMRLSGAGLGLAMSGVGLKDARGRNHPKLDDGPHDFFAAAPIETVRIGFVGVGGMGTIHVRNLVQIPGAVITAVCDIRDEHARRAANIITDAGLPTDMNVYDATALSAVIELTGQSNAKGSHPVDFPDFTRERWKTWRWPESSAFGQMAAMDTLAAVNRAGEASGSK